MVHAYEEVIEPLDVVHIDPDGKMTEYRNVTYPIADEGQGGFGVLPMTGGEALVAVTEGDGRMIAMKVDPNTNVALCLRDGGTVAVFNCTEDDEDE